MSHFNGSSSQRMWEAVRASAAAPAYFSEFKIDDIVLLVSKFSFDATISIDYFFVLGWRSLGQ